MIPEHFGILGGEAVQYGMIQSALAPETHQLYGMDLAKNADSYGFKLKMGGEIVKLPLGHAYPVNVMGRFVPAAGTTLEKL